MKKLIFISLLIMCGCMGVNNERIIEFANPDKLSTAQVDSACNEIMDLAIYYLSGSDGGGHIYIQSSSTAIINDSIEISIKRIK